MTCYHGPDFVITVGGDFKPGDQAPEGYLAWHEWAEIQHKAGLRQQECGKCGKWKYPQELSGETISTEVRARNGRPRTIVLPVCNGCFHDGPADQENAA
ncbi:hypothetical protein [Aurantimonas coralicida]|uniref:hypothetical protein n=1 Tax=Aurantimonas coralicida TaxID=182270 RepID=UPI00239DC25B|nr:hypothetical protein [Aurantimonas coralicida]MDE0924774.1 hypothetical protein [Aurantimonas coralicida]